MADLAAASGDRPATWWPPATARCGSPSPGRGRMIRVDPADGSTPSSIAPARRSASCRGRPVADRHRRDRRGRPRPGSPGLALRPRRADAAADGPAGARRSPPQPPARRAPASASARDLQPVHRRRARRAGAEVAPGRRDPGPVPAPAGALPDRRAGPPARRTPATCSSTSTSGCSSAHRHPGRLRRAAAQEDYSLDPPPDATIRPDLDYRLLDGATVGDRELFYVYDAANARILAYQRADGAFVRQWLAPRSGPGPACWTMWSTCQRRLGGRRAAGRVRCSPPDRWSASSSSSPLESIHARSLSAG